MKNTMGFQLIRMDVWNYILALFLNRSEYLKIKELSEFLYVSPQTLTNELKKVGYVLDYFNLKLDRKPY